MRILVLTPWEAARLGLRDGDRYQGMRVVVSLFVPPDAERVAL